MPWNLWTYIVNIKKYADRQIRAKSSHRKTIPGSQLNCIRAKINPCVSCGACCALFLVSFPNDESDHCPDGVVPFELSGALPNSRRYMKGTNGMNPRCVALEGFVGTQVKCKIYKDRPSSCRAFCRSWEDNVGNHLCDRARRAYGLQAFSQY